jgi:hypothetical protein
LLLQLRLLLLLFLLLPNRLHRCGCGLSVALLRIVSALRAVVGLWLQL